MRGTHNPCLCFTHKQPCACEYPIWDGLESMYTRREKERKKKKQPVSICSPSDSIRAAAARLSCGWDEKRTNEPDARYVHAARLGDQTSLHVPATQRSDTTTHSQMVAAEVLPTFWRKYPPHLQCILQCVTTKSLTSVSLLVRVYGPESHLLSSGANTHNTFQCSPSVCDSQILDIRIPSGACVRTS